MKQISGVLLIYRHPFTENSPALKQHINSFTSYSRYPIWTVNSKYGFPKRLSKLKFSIIVLHYSVFPIAIDKKFSKYLDYLYSNPESKKIAFFQDEHAYCVERFNFIDNIGIDVIYSLLIPEEHKKVYLNNTNCKNIVHTLTGYVDNSLINKAKMLTKPEMERSIDIGYRARELPYHTGKGGQDKTRIATEFFKRINPSKFVVDIRTGEDTRFSGDSWYQFLAECRAMIGVEAGVSIFDLDGKAQSACKQFLDDHPDATFETVHASVLKPWEENIYYRTISPRVFECAAFKVCMILFKGRYNDILKPMVHYIPLEKDFSNFDWVMDIFNNAEERHRLTENAYRDLIDSKKYSYRSFIKEFDNHLAQMGIEITIDDKNQIARKLNNYEWLQMKKIKISRSLRKLIKSG